jgi:hypothetical protein
VNPRTITRAFRRFDEQRRVTPAEGVQHLGFFVRDDTWVPITGRRVTQTDIQPPTKRRNAAHSRTTSL